MPSRAATAHSITVPLRHYGLHRSATREGTDGALYPCPLAMSVRHARRAAFCAGSGLGRPRLCRRGPLRRPLAGIELPRYPHPRRTGQWPRAQRHGHHLPQQLPSPGCRTCPDPDGHRLRLRRQLKSLQRLYGSDDSVKIFSMHSSKGLSSGWRDTRRRRNVEKERGRSG